MYAYVNDHTGVLVALAPSTRGRPAANHAPADEELRISVNNIPASVLAEKDIPTSTLKEYVTAHGSDAGAVGLRDPASPLLLNELLVAFADILHQTRPLAAKKCHELLARWSADVIDGSSIAEWPSIAEWTADALVVISKCRRSVNMLLNQSEDGWRKGTQFAVSAETAPAAPVKQNVLDSVDMTAAPSDNFGALAGTKKDGDGTGVFYPKSDKTYIIKRQIENLFKLLQASSKKSPQNVNLIGPHGCGKTELAIQFAAQYARPMLIMDCANLREARDWFGYKTARDGTVYWNESQFVRAVQTGNHVVLLDELNRANPSLLNTLMPLLDGRRFTYLEERGDNIVVGPGTVFFATMNEGAGYTGTSTLDRAVRDRFPRAVELSYLDEADEIQLLVNRTGIDTDDATRLVQLANKIRRDSTGMSASLTESLSTRQLIAAAHDYVLGGVDTLEFTITNHFSPDGDEDSERVKVQNIIQGKFGDIIAAIAAAGA